MKLAAKQLLALGVPPQHIGALDRWADETGVTLRELVQQIIAQRLHQREGHRES